MTETESILVVEDEQANRHILANMLDEDYRLLMASTAEQGIARAEKHMPSLILLDINLPDMSGFDVIQQLSSNPITRDIPIIFLTALSSETEEEQGLLAGAVDYITKPFSPVIVKIRINIHMEIVRQRAMLERLSNLDGLTQIANRRKFDEVIDEEWRRAMRSATPISIAMIDIDHFKQFNDHYGHTAGDEVLKLVASALQAQMKRAGDICARYGGEEFILVMPGASIDAAYRIAEACRLAICGLSITHDYSSCADKITLSIGVATIRPEQSNDMKAFIHQADTALYQAKNEGRNRVTRTAP